MIFSTERELPVVCGRPRNAVDRLVSENLGIIDFVIKRKFSIVYANQTQYEEAYETGLMALWSAAKLYNPAKGMKFSSYAFMWIQGKILQKLKFDANRAKRISFSLDEAAGEDGEISFAERIPDPCSDTDYAGILTDDAMQSMASVLHGRRRDIFVGAYVEDASLSSIATRCGVTRSCIGSQHQAMLKDLRKYYPEWKDAVLPSTAPGASMRV